METYIPIALIVACLLALTLIFLSARRIQKEGLSIRGADRQHFVRSIDEVRRQQEQEQAMLNMAADTGKGSATHSRVGFGKIVQLGVDDAVKRVEGELKNRGFQLTSTTDAAAVLHEAQLPAYRIMTFIHKELSGKAIYVEPALGLIVANAIVRQDLGGDVHVEFTDPALVANQSGSKELQEAASEIKSRLMQTLQAI